MIKNVMKGHNAYTVLRYVLMEDSSKYAVS